MITPSMWAGQCSWYSDWVRAGRSRDRIPVGARFSTPVQTGPGVPPSLLCNGYRVFPRSKERPGRDADPSPLLVPWSRKSRAIPLLPLWAVRPVQSLSACTRVHFFFYFTPSLHCTFFTNQEFILSKELTTYLKEDIA